MRDRRDRRDRREGRDIRDRREGRDRRDRRGASGKCDTRGALSDQLGRNSKRGGGVKLRHEVPPPPPDQRGRGAGLPVRICARRAEGLIDTYSLLSLDVRLWFHKGTHISE